MTVIVNMHEAKTQLSKLVERVRRGEDIVIAKNGDPVARLVAVRPKGKRPAGTYAGRIRIADDFDAALPDEFTGIAE